MSSKTVTVYSDYKSPYAYLAKDPIEQLASELKCELRWLPYILPIPDFLGTVESRNAHQWRRVRYSYMDARRLANRRGLTVRGPRKIFDSSLIAVGMLYAQRHGAFHSYNDIVFERFWKRELDIEDLKAVTAVLRETGAGTDGFAEYAESEGRRELDRICRDAEDLGVFGVPTFVVGNEIFWGGDRLWMVREQLTR
ncbi:MAG: 2-hydroxychromene-2-carboxylate isomerase [Candidatus Binataceae bacterium]